MRKPQRIPKPHRPQNAAEAECYDKLTANGWQVTKKGWPDFFVTKGNKFAVVEVKRRNTHRLKYHQRLVMKLLSSMGIPCYRYDYDNHFTRIGLDAPQEDKKGCKKAPDLKPLKDEVLKGDN